MACDACGCSVNGGGVGLLTAFRNNTVGLSWQYAPFEASEAVGTDTRDYFQTVELFVSYHLNRRWQLAAFLPYRHNRRLTEGGNVRLDGISDLRLLGTYAFIDYMPGGGQSQFYWDAGTGVKAPTGRYDADIYRRNLPDNFNLGGGGWSWLLQSRLLYRLGNFGATANGAFQSANGTASGYRFGHQVSAAALLFVRKTLGARVEGTLFGGMLYEEIGPDDYPHGKAPHPTGGEGFYAATVLNLKAGDWLLSANYAHPVGQRYAGGEVVARPRVSLSGAFVF